MPKITIANEKKEIEVPAGSNLRDELKKAGVETNPGLSRVLNCRGNGLCGTCRVMVKKGMENVSTKGMKEKFTFLAHPMALFASIGHETEIRLSCQCTVNGDCTVEVRPEMNWSGENFWQKPYPNK
ncbi:MAG: 2Fe-2S iron-sulfur cluster-binding protein [Gemmataceae bacterium]